MPAPMNIRSKDASILHLVQYEKFIPAFISFVEQEFNECEHHFFFLKNGGLYTPSGGTKITANSTQTSLPKYLWKLRSEIMRADKVICHGLFDSKALLILFLHPYFLKKIYWIVWGGDLYTYAENRKTWRWRLKEVFRRRVIKRVGHLVTHVYGDYKLAQKWYGAEGAWHECFVYPSNLYHEATGQGASSPRLELSVMIGNSADPSNNHIELMDRLANIRDVKIYCPLSYGNAQYADKVESRGYKIFGQNFTALRKFMDFPSYLAFLSQIDVAIFNHRRQQGMGNITTLLGLGKKVYIRKDITSYEFFEGIGVKLFDASDELSKITRIDPEVAWGNRAAVKNYFSKENLIKGLREVFQ